MDGCCKKNIIEEEQLQLSDCSKQGKAYFCDCYMDKTATNNEPCFREIKLKINMLLDVSHIITNNKFYICRLAQNRMNYVVKPTLFPPQLYWINLFPVSVHSDIVLLVF